MESPHREKFDVARTNVRQHACVSCLVLTEPTRIKKINVETWKAFRKPDGIDMDHPYIKLALFRIFEFGQTDDDTQGEALDEEILREYAEQLGNSDEESENEGGDSGDEQVSGTVPAL